MERWLTIGRPPGITNASAANKDAIRNADLIFTVLIADCTSKSDDSKTKFAALTVCPKIDG